MHIQAVIEPLGVCITKGRSQKASRQSVRRKRYEAKRYRRWRRARDREGPIDDNRSSIIGLSGVCCGDQTRETQAHLRTLAGSPTKPFHGMKRDKRFSFGITKHVSCVGSESGSSSHVLMRAAH